MRNGGYQLIDLLDRNLDPTGHAPAVIEGIYDKIERSYRKPILLTGVTIDKVEKHDAFVTVQVAVGGSYHLIYGSNYIEISKQDEVTFHKGMPQ